MTQPLGTPVLVDKACDLSSFAGEDGRFPLSVVHVTPGQHVQATNGHLLVRVALPALPGDDFPACGREGATPDAPFSVGAEDFAGIIKAIPKGRDVKHMPILQAVALTSGDGKINAVSTDLSTVQRRACAVPDATFPNADKILSSVEPITSVTLDPNYLILIAQHAKRNGATSITLDLSGAANPARLRAEILGADGSRRDMLAILMPMRGLATEEEKARKVPALKAV